MNLGIVTGVAFEASLLRPHVSDGLTVICAGLRPNAAQTAAEVLIDQGADALLSFGIAGGLDPKAAAGRIVVASEVRGETVFACDPGWTARLSALVGTTPAPIAHTTQVIATPAGKAALFTASGAAAVDMESYGVGEVAADHGLPFAVLRAVADTAVDAIPSVALNAMSLDGHVQHVQAVLGALTHPWQIPELMRLGRRTAIATAVLKDLTRLGAGLFGLM